MDTFKFTVIVVSDEIESKYFAMESLWAIINQSIGFADNIEMIIATTSDCNHFIDLYVDLYQDMYPGNIKTIRSDTIDESILKAMMQAQGEYITIIKIGDTLGTSTMEQVYDYFPSHNGMLEAAGIRIVSDHPVYTDYVKNFEKKDKELHLRDNYLSAPVNMLGIFFKRLAGCRIVEKGLTGYEESSFLAELLLRRKTLGLLGSTAYIQSHQEPEEIISAGDFFDRIHVMHDFCRQIRNHHGYLPYYTQSAVVTEIYEQLDRLENLMNLYRQPEYHFENQWAEFTDLMSMIDNDIFMKVRSSRFKKLFLLEHKYNRPAELDVFTDDVHLTYQNTVTYGMSSFITRIMLIEIKDGVLSIEGQCQVPAGVDLDKFQVFAIVNGEYYPTEQKEHYSNRYYLDQLYLRVAGFKVSIELKDEIYSIGFANSLDGFTVLKKKTEYVGICVLDKKLKNAYYYKDGYMLYLQGTDIVCQACSEEMRMNREKALQREISKVNPSDAKTINEIRNYYWDNINLKEKEIWLIIDRPDRADDNGEAFFRYMAAKKDPYIDIYFVLKAGSPGYEDLCRIGKVIEPASEEHQKLHAIADYIISSQMSEGSSNPYNERSDYMRDIVVRPRFIWLQHGVIHNDHAVGMGRLTKNFFGFLSSARREHEYLLSPKFQYTPDVVWLLGMPRFDLLYHDEKKIITMMPTWRKYLTTRAFSEEQNTLIWKVNDDFAESEYVKFFSSLITDERLLKTAEKYGYKINFMLHVNFLHYAHLFKESNVVNIIQYDMRYRDIYAQSNLILTDYSSAVFDFAYLHKPIIYCQFDKEKFYATHTVKEGYFDFEKDGFGEVTYNVEDTVKLLVEYIENDCRLKDKYRERIDTFFGYIDKHCCDRLFDRILKTDERYQELKVADDNTQGLQIIDKVFNPYSQVH